MNKKKKKIKELEIHMFKDIVTGRLKMQYTSVSDVNDEYLLTNRSSF